MPDISDQIDKISTQIANKVSIAHEQVVDALMELVKGNLLKKQLQCYKLLILRN